MLHQARYLALLGLVTCLTSTLTAQTQSKPSNSPSPQVATNQPPPKNIVLILADDLGWSDLACYGSDLHETPHLDAFATTGIRFTQAYSASPVCSPTRASILTGRHPARLQMTIWRENAANRGRRRLLEPVVLDHLPLQEFTLAEVLQKSGYATAHIGKWHLGTAPFYPESHGFDLNIAGTLWGAPETFFYPFRGDTYFREFRYVPGLEPGSPGDYLTDRLTDKAIEFIEHQANRPFFLNLWYHSVHTPIEGKKALVAKYRAKIKPGGRHVNPDYAAMVESLDENVGRVMNKLDELNIAGNTIVIFLSDNGGFINSCKLHPGQPVTNNSPLRSGKGAVYEGGIRIPMIVRAPGVTPTNAICTAPATTCDLFPTLLELAGIAEPQPTQTLDGISLKRWLENPSSPGPDRSLPFHYPHYYPTTTPVSALRKGPWKLIHFYEDQKTELYNLEGDPGEANDLAEREKERTREMLQALESWLDDVHAPMTETNPDWKSTR